MNATEKGVVDLHRIRFPASDETWDRIEKLARDNHWARTLIDAIRAGINPNEVILGLIEGMISSNSYMETLAMKAVTNCLPSYIVQTGELRK